MPGSMQRAVDAPRRGAMELEEQELRAGVGVPCRARAGKPPSVPAHHVGARALGAADRGPAGERGARLSTGHAWGATPLYSDPARRWGKAAPAVLGGPDASEPPLSPCL